MKALITGITGQDGSYLAEFLLSKGYEVHGMQRRCSVFNTERLEQILQKVHLHYGDILDSANLSHLIQTIRPDEVYNLAAQSHVKVSFDVPVYTADCTGVGTLRLLDAVRSAGLGDTCKIYHASTSEMFGQVQEIPQKESTPFYPKSPYGVAKLYAHWIIKNYRESYKMFAVSGILFNHESPRRGKTFVTRKITQGVARIASGKQTVLTLGCLNALRDWGHARDYVKAMWMMLQQKQPEDLVVATGEQHSVREFCTIAFNFTGRRLVWKGTGLDEKGVDEESGVVLVEVSPVYFRPSEVETLLGDATKARAQLGWKPETSFLELVYDMVSSDMETEGLSIPSYQECVSKLK